MTRFAVLLLLGAALAPAEVVNTPAPELEIKMESGQTVKLSQYKGKPILLEFFSTTCPHCQSAAAAMEKTLRTYGPKGLQVIAVSTDEAQRKEFSDFRQKYGATYPMGIVARDSGYQFFSLSMMKPFYVPTYAFIDKTGTIRAQYIGGLQVHGTAAEEAELAKNVEAILKPAPAKPAPPQAKPTAKR